MLNVPKVSSSSRDLARANLCLYGRPSHCSLPSSLFPSKCPPPFECFYDSPCPYQRRFQNRFRAFPPSFLFCSLFRPVHVDVSVNASLSCIFVLISPPVGANIHYFLFHTIGGLGGGYRRNTLLLNSKCLLRLLPRLFRRVGWVPHAHHASIYFFIVDTFGYSCSISEYFYSPLFGSNVFRGGYVPTAR